MVKEVKMLERKIQQHMAAKSLISHFLNSTPKLNIDVEVSMHDVCVASLLISVESVVESMVSSYKHRFNEQWNLLDENENDEMDICVNEPKHNRCDSVVKKALDRHFSNSKSKI